MILTVYKTCIVHAHNMRYTLSGHALSMYFTGITHVTKRITVAVSDADYQILQSLALENDRSLVAQMGRMIRTWSEATKPTLLPQGNTPKPTKPEPEAKITFSLEEQEAKRLATPQTKHMVDPSTGETFEETRTVGEWEEIAHERTEKALRAEREHVMAHNASMDTEAPPIFTGIAPPVEDIFGMLD
jgi:hypothetical protein